jgi:phage terminase large subunit GpA-like protein
MSIWGAGAPKESDSYDRPEQLYLIDRIVLYGNIGRADVWQQLDDVLATPYKNEDGVELKIQAAAIDSGGHYTEEVYRWAKDRAALGVMPIKGVDRLKGDIMLGKPNKVEYGARGKLLKNSVKLFSIGVNKVKSYLYRRLRDAEPGDGYLHFYPTITEEYFEELTAEKEVRKYKAGKVYERVWRLKSGARNEAWDELIYAYSCVLRLYQTHNRRTMWTNLANKLLNPANSNGKNTLKSKNTMPKQSYVNQW